MGPYQRARDRDAGEWCGHYFPGLFFDQSHGHGPHRQTHPSHGRARPGPSRAKHRHAVTGVVRGAFLSLFYVIVLGLVLERFGVPLATLAAPAAALGVGLGFGAQRLVQDLLAGFFIVSERQYDYGDTVAIKTVVGTVTATGTVEEVTLRVTRLRTVDGEVVFVPNGQILLTTNLSETGLGRSSTYRSRRASTSLP